MQTVAIIGLGYVGLPLAQAATHVGHQVIGFDTSSRVVEGLTNGQSHVDDLSDAEIAEMGKLGFSATSDGERLAEADVIVVCVPTPLTKDGSPELGPIRSASEAVASTLKHGQVVVLESTTFPGTTEEIVQPILEAGGLRVGVDFSLAFSPERIDPGNATYGIVNTPKVVGGVTPTCTARAVAFYESFIDTVVEAKGTREAEMAKLLENTYRHINIALVNELARVSHELDIDIWDVIRCASTKPFGFQAFYPSAGVGGHCIPIDPNYLSYAVKSKLGYPLRFVELAQEINATMPRYVVSRIQEQLNFRSKALNGSRILLIGVTYKQDIADQRESPAIPLAALLQNAGAKLSYLDPHVDMWIDGVERFTSPGVELESLFDLAVVLQHHASVELSEITSYAVEVLDTRGKLSGNSVASL